MLAFVNVKRLALLIPQKPTRGRLQYFRLHIYEAVKHMQCCSLWSTLAGERPSECMSSMKNGTVEEP